MDSVARVSTLLDTTRDLTVDAATTGLARTVNARQLHREWAYTTVKGMLESRHEQEVLEALKHVITMMYRQERSLPYFGPVVKLAGHASLAVRRLVYIYLIHHAEDEPDTALLAINSIQKTLSDPQPIARALALRTMAGLRVPLISQIVLLAIKRGCADASPLVRKSAALAIPKCYRLDPATHPQLEELVAILLDDPQYFVVGPAMMAFSTICPARMDLLHGRYRGLVRKLVDMDEWSQLVVVRLLLSYSLQCFPATPNQAVKDRQYRPKSSKKAAASGKAAQVVEKEHNPPDPDLQVFLHACRKMLHNHNSAVVLAVAEVLLSLGDEDDVATAAGSLVALLRGSPDIQQVALQNIVACGRPQAFAKYYARFLQRTDDNCTVISLKIEMQTLIYPFCPSLQQELLLSELEKHMQSADLEISRWNARALGLCAQTDERSTRLVLHLLLQSITNSDDEIVGTAVTAIRLLIQQDPDAHVHTVIVLAQNLDRLTSPEARAAVVWLVSENASRPREQNVARDVLAILVSGFAEESSRAKLAILVLAARVYLDVLMQRERGQSGTFKMEIGEQHDLGGKSSTQDRSEVSPDQGGRKEHRSFKVEKASLEVDEERSDDSARKMQHEAQDSSDISLDELIDRVRAVWDLLVLLALEDECDDVRDRAIFYAGIFRDNAPTDEAKAILLQPKLPPKIPQPSDNRRGYRLGTSALIVGTREIPGYEELPLRVEAGKEPDRALRDVRVEALAETQDVRRSVPIYQDSLGSKKNDSMKRTDEHRRREEAAKALDDWLNASDDAQSEDS